MQFFFEPKKKDAEKEAAVEEVLLDGYDRYYRLAYSYVGNPDDAGDIVQEGAYKAIKNSQALQNIEYAGTWVYRIMLNEVFSFCRKRKEQSTGEMDSIECGREDRYENVDLTRALEVLDEKDRAVVILRYFEDYKLGEIAQILDENINTTKSRLYRSIKKLRLQLDNDWIWEEA